VKTKTRTDRNVCPTRNGGKNPEFVAFVETGHDLSIPQTANKINIMREEPDKNEINKKSKSKAKSLDTGSRAGMTGWWCCYVHTAIHVFSYYLILKYILFYFF